MQKSVAQTVSDLCYLMHNQDPDEDDRYQFIATSEHFSGMLGIVESIMHDERFKHLLSDLMGMLQTMAYHYDETERTPFYVSQTNIPAIMRQRFLDELRTFAREKNYTLYDLTPYPA